MKGKVGSRKTIQAAIDEVNVRVAWNTSEECGCS
jgi:hypothetical protein